MEQRLWRYCASVVACLLVAGCTLTDWATPQEAIALQEQDAAIEARAQDAQAAAEERALLHADLAEAIAAGDAVLAAELQKQIQVKDQEILFLIQSKEALEAERAELEKEIASRPVGAVQQLAASLGIPLPLIPFSEEMLGLLMLMAFDRPRKSAGRAIKDLFTGNVGGFVSGVLQTFGARHSTANSYAAADRFVEVAKSEGRHEAAGRVRDIIDAEKKRDLDAERERIGVAA